MLLALRQLVQLHGDDENQLPVTKMHHGLRQLIDGQ
jgi:hypothetical protein